MKGVCKFLKDAGDVVEGCERMIFFLFFFSLFVCSFWLLDSAGCGDYGVRSVLTHRLPLVDLDFF
jgi:hypothetical protein